MMDNNFEKRKVTPVEMVGNPLNRNFNAVASIGFSNAIEINGDMVFWPVLTGSGAISATIDLLISPDGDTLKEKSFLLNQTPIVISGTNTATDYTEVMPVTGVVRLRVTAISGTNASVTLMARG